MNTPLVGFYHYRSGKHICRGHDLEMGENTQPSMSRQKESVAIMQLEVLIGVVAAKSHACDKSASCTRVCTHSCTTGAEWSVAGEI